MVNLCSPAQNLIFCCSFDSYGCLQLFYFPSVSISFPIIVPSCFPYFSIIFSIIIHHYPSKEPNKLKDVMSFFPIPRPPPGAMVSPSRQLPAKVTWVSRNKTYGFHWDLNIFNPPNIIYPHIHNYYVYMYKYIYTKYIHTHTY